MFKKYFDFLLILVMPIIMISVASAQEQNNITNTVFSDNIYGTNALAISPPSGIYVSSQGFDLVLIVHSPGLSSDLTNVTWNDTDVTAMFDNCAILGILLTADGTTLRCPALSGVFLGTGTHTISARVFLSDGSSVTNSVTWVVTDNAEPFD